MALPVEGRFLCADGYTVRMTLVGSDRAWLVVACGLVGLGAGWLACGWAWRWAGSSRPDGSWRAPAAVLALAWGSLAARYGLTPELLELCALAVVLLLLSLTDLERRIIPNECILCILGIRMLYLCLGHLCGRIGVAQIAYYASSAVLVGVVLVLTILVADRLFATESMGGGDLKLLAALALYVGWQQSMLLVALACLLGLAGVALARALGEGGDERGAFPFGPAIAAGCVATLLVGDAVVGWYVGLLVP